MLIHRQARPFTKSAPTTSNNFVRAPLSKSYATHNSLSLKNLVILRQSIGTNPPDTIP
ncbi:hypothetical protein [Rubritalea tangerina]|uniref:hypothetical protein n=1 Tax=Rubritalea tangerina TaxID=430798 RepID=UPI00360DB8D9